MCHLKVKKIAVIIMITRHDLIAEEVFGQVVEGQDKTMTCTFNNKT